MYRNLGTCVQICIAKMIQDILFISKLWIHRMHIFYKELLYQSPTKTLNKHNCCPSTYPPTNLPTYLYIYISIYLSTYVHTYIHTYIYTYRQSFIHTNTFTSKLPPLYIHTHKHNFTCTYANPNQSIQRQDTQFCLCFCHHWVDS